MNKQKLLSFLILFVAFSVSISCKKAKKIEEPNNIETILKADLLGTFEITETSVTENSDLINYKKNVLWNIEEDQISINCGDKISYSISENIISRAGVQYTVKEKTKKSNYELSFKIGTDAYQIIISKTNKTCDGNTGGEEESGPTIGTVALDKLSGYGEETTGGAGATTANTHHFDDGNKFNAWLAAREKAKSKVPAIVWLSGTFTKENGRAASSPWFDIKDTENITIYGVNNFKMQNVGFFLARAQNIIIRNVYIIMPKADNGADGISMQKSNKVWVDHCTFESVNQTSDYEDGSCDVTHGTSNVTISWNHFIKTQKTSLVGHSDSETGDVAIKATYHHNFFDVSSSRHPRVRYGTVHVYNNYFKQVSTYGVGSAMGAKVLVEANNFTGVHLPTDICTFPAKKSGSSMVSNLTGKIAGYLYASANVYNDKPGNSSDPYPFTNVEFLAYGGDKLTPVLTRNDFLPPYTYVVDDAEKINTIVPAGAGVGKLPNFTTAPIAVDNGNISLPETPDPGDGDPGTGGEQGVALGNNWYSVNIGDAAGTYTLSADKKGIEMAGKGKFESGVQSFNFIYREQTGDFEMTAKLESYTIVTASNQALAGILFSTGISNNATEFIHGMSAKGGKTAEEFNYSHRVTPGNSSRGVLASPASNTSNAYLKLKRVGNIYYASYSLDGGLTYGAERNGTFTDLPQKVYLGFAVNSGSSSASTAAKFSDIKINGQAVNF